LYILLPHPAPPEIYTLSLHDALPICCVCCTSRRNASRAGIPWRCSVTPTSACWRSTRRTVFLNGVTISVPSTWRSPPSARSWARSEEHTSELQSLRHLVCRLLLEKKK